MTPPGRQCAFNDGLDNAHGHSAVNNHVFSSDEVIFNQAGDQLSNILWLAFCVQWDAILDIVSCLFGGERIMKGSADNAGRYAVDPNALIGKFAGKDAGELRQSAFYHTVSGCAQTAAQASRGSQQDDRSPTLLCHVRRGGSGEVKDGVHVNGKGVHPALIRDRIKPARDGSSRRVHQNIEAAKVFDYPLDTLAAICGVGYVAFQEPGRCAVTLDGREKTVWRLDGLSGNAGYVSAFSCQGESSGGPDTAGTPSY
jgi:hypothetical protein